jgi:hypothetical protein
VQSAALRWQVAQLPLATALRFLPAEAALRKRTIVAFSDAIVGYHNPLNKS